MGLAAAVAVGTTALAALAAGAVAVGGKLLSLASDAEETASKFATVFGANASAVDAWVKKTNAAYGITTKALQDVTSRFGVFGKAAGIAAGDLPKFSTELAQAGLDLSSFYNVDPEEAFQALSSGLAGEAEPLRRFGIFLSDATMKAEAASMGLRGELTESQKVAVRQRLILKGLGDANGDLERTSDSLANKWRALKGRGEELATNLGRGLVPVAQDVVNWLDGKLAPVTQRLTANIDTLRVAVSDAAGGRGYGALASVLDVIVGGNGRVENAVNGVGDTITRIIDLGRRLRDGWRAGGLEGLVAGFDDGTAAGGFLATVLGNIVTVGRNLLTIWRDGVTPALEDLGPVIGGVLSPSSSLVDVTGFLADNASTLTPIIEMLAAGWAAYKVITIAAAAQQWILNTALTANPIGIVIVALAALAAGLVYAYRHSESFRNIVDSIGRGVRAVFGWLLDNWRTIATVGLGGPIGALVVLYQKVGPVRRAVDGVLDVLQAIGSVAFSGLKSAVKWIADKLAGLVRTARRVADAVGNIPGAGLVGDVVGALPGIGDTPRPHAGGRGARRRAGRHALGNTLAAHAAADRATPGRRRITSTIRGHALGSGNSDHRTGRALDVVGGNLNTYARNFRAMGGFAEHHGTGSGRHLHAAIGDTPRPRASSSTAPAVVEAPIIFQAGAVTVVNPASDVEVERAVARGIRRYVRERNERR